MIRRVFLACLAGIALLFTGSVALIAWATREAPPGAPSPAPAVAEADAESVTAAQIAMIGPDPAAPASDDLGVVPLPPPGDPGGLGARVPALAAPRAGPDLASRAPAPMPPARREALSGFRRDLMAGFARLQDRVAGCALAGATFELDLEGVEGGVKIVDAVLASRGEATDAAVSCARSALKGEVIRAPGVQRGRQWRMQFAARSSS